LHGWCRLVAYQLKLVDQHIHVGMELTILAGVLANVEFPLHKQGGSFGHVLMDGLSWPAKGGAVEPGGFFLPLFAFLLADGQGKPGDSDSLRGRGQLRVTPNVTDQCDLRKAHHSLSFCGFCRFSMRRVIP